ncbi:MerR family transcriptional regulator, partial [Halorhodospira neutriphila]|uniref:MerR family transcriptional regulator n=1 Tax=Halorhodospira neutriphila TaxID=168379 RepID=UPI0019038DCF
MPDAHAIYPIRTVARVTGVNPVTLRAWERRYGLLQPQRTAKGHRLYTEADIARVRRILVLLDRGVPISRAREALAQGEETPAATEPEPPPWPEWRERLEQALTRFEPAALEGAVGELLRLYPADRAVCHVLLPTLEARLGGPPEAEAEARLLSAFLRGHLGHLANRLQQQRLGGLRLVVAAPPGPGLAPPAAELALSALTLAALSAGHRPVLLGEQAPAL